MVIEAYMGGLKGGMSYRVERVGGGGGGGRGMKNYHREKITVIGEYRESGGVWGVGMQ